MSVQAPIPVFETQVKCWNVYQDHSHDFRHFSIPAERGTAFSFSLTWQAGLRLSRQLLDRDFSVTAGEHSKERKSRWITRIKAGSCCFPLDNILAINRSGQSSGSWLLLPSCRCSGKPPQELALLGWWLTPRPSAAALEEPAGKHCPAWHTLLAVPGLNAMPLDTAEWAACS